MRTPKDRRDVRSIGAPTTAWRRAVRVIVADKAALASLLTLGFLALGFLLGPYLYKTNQTDQFRALFEPQNLPPNAHHWLGTDDEGYDVLGRLMWAGRWTITLGLLAGLIATFVGTSLGAVMGYGGGMVRGGLGRIADALLMIPYPILLLALCVVVPDARFLIVALTGWFGIAIFVSEHALPSDDPTLAHPEALIGGGRFQLLRRHVLPNSMRMALSIWCFAIADALLAFLFLDWVGFNPLLPPRTDLATMMIAGVGGLSFGYWWELYPAMILFVVVVVCLNVLGGTIQGCLSSHPRESP